MCGRYISLSEDILKDIVLSVSMDIPIAELNTGEVFPSNYVLVKTKEGYTAMHWGIPKWDGKGRIINARQESLLTKPYFREDFIHHRCVVFMEGFYEWDQQVPKNKYRIWQKGKTMMKVAGLYKYIDQIPYFVILTQAAIPSFEHIHNRLPLMLDDYEIMDYLSGNDVQQWTRAKHYDGLCWEVLR